MIFIQFPVFLHSILFVQSLNEVSARGQILQFVFHNIGSSLIDGTNSNDINAIIFNLMQISDQLVALHFSSGFSWTSKLTQIDVSASHIVNHNIELVILVFGSLCNEKLVNYSKFKKDIIEELLTLSGDSIGVALLDNVHGQLKVGIGHVDSLEPIEATGVQIVIEVLALVLVFFPRTNKRIIGICQSKDGGEQNKGLHDDVW